MTTEEKSIRSRLYKIVVDRLSLKEDEVANLSDESDLVQDLNGDSLDVVELTMAVEEEFGAEDNPLEISDDEAEKVKTVGDILVLLQEKGIKDA